jgi:DNA-binding CsgD family transcriptional regulator
MNMIPALVVLYILLIGLAVGGSLWSFRLRQRYGLPFLRTYHIFVLLSFAYAVMNFIGEVFAPAILPGPPESMIRIYLIVDLVTIPLLGGLFFLFFSWITRLLGRRVPPALKVVFGGIEALFLAAFMITFVSYFVRGISALSYAEIYILNGIIGILLIAAVLLLFFAAPAGDEPDRRRLARGLGAAYAISLAVLVASLVAPRASLVPKPEIANAIPAGLIFLFNLPALFYLQRSLRIWPPRQDPAFSEVKGLAGLAGDVGISDREKEIIRLVALGLDNREIGRRLFISPKTVKNHMTSIYAKTGARNRVQLANLLNRPEQDSGT